MYASKVDYLKGNVFYVYDSETDEQIATVVNGSINWEDGEELYNSATAKVLEAISKV